jgi:hypothetical protein
MDMFFLLKTFLSPAAEGLATLLRMRGGIASPEQRRDPARID